MEKYSRVLTELLADGWLESSDNYSESIYTKNILKGKLQVYLSLEIKNGLVFPSDFSFTFYPISSKYTSVELSFLENPHHLIRYVTGFVPEERETTKYKISFILESHYEINEHFNHGDISRNTMTNVVVEEIE